MKGIVVYYSATGNTKKIARAIHRGMKGMIECDIASVKEADPQDMAKYDIIGIGAPIWYFREPANVRLFINNMPNLEGKLCFSFCTHGTQPAGILFTMRQALTRKDLSVIGGKDWYGSVYTVLHAVKPYFTDGHPDEIDLKEAEDFGREMAELAQKIVAGEASVPEMAKGPEADPLWRPHSMAGGAFGLKLQYKIDMEKCKHPECAVCVECCPMNSIDFSVTPPVFRTNCLGCYLCERVCPEGAIEVDEETARIRPHRIINMEKCTYPECTLCVDHCPMNAIDFSVSPPVFKHNCDRDDLCWVICPKGAIEITNIELNHARLGRGFRREDRPVPNMLEEAEAKGRFRRLVPLDKVGWDNPVWKNPNHPRFVIEED